ncbi:MAG: NifB/NifX family molybdenum-iron cluster-binding protein [Anaerovoracaceae bacterium]
MKIAVTHDKGQIFQHFGHSAEFKVYEIEDNKVVSSTILETGTSGHGALATLLKDNAVDALICGGIGGGAKIALGEAGIELFPGVSGDADLQVEAYLAGNLNFDADTVCSHHGEDHHHEEGHNCAHGTCGK